MENCTPKPGIHCEDCIYVPEACVFIICLLVRSKGQFVIYKDVERYPSMKLYRKIKSRESNRNGFLNTSTIFSALMNTIMAKSQQYVWEGIFCTK